MYEAAALAKEVEDTPDKSTGWSGQTDRFSQHLISLAGKCWRYLFRCPPSSHHQPLDASRPCSSEAANCSRSRKSACTYCFGRRYLNTAYRLFCSSLSIEETSTSECESTPRLWDANSCMRCSKGSTFKMVPLPDPNGHERRTEHSRTRACARSV